MAGQIRQRRSHKRVQKVDLLIARIAEYQDIRSGCLSSLQSTQLEERADIAAAGRAIRSIEDQVKALRTALARLETAFTQAVKECRATLIELRSMEVAQGDVFVSANEIPLDEVVPFLDRESLRLEEQVEARLAERTHIGEAIAEVRATLDEASLGRDADPMAGSLAAAEKMAARWHLVEANAKVTETVAAVANSRAARQAAQRRLDAARDDARQLTSGALDAGVETAVAAIPPEQTDTTDAIEQSASRLADWTDERRRCLEQVARIEEVRPEEAELSPLESETPELSLFAHGAEDHHESGGVGRLHPPVTSNREPISPPPELEPAGGRPVLADDPLVLALLSGQIVDTWDALGRPESVSTIVYLERLEILVHSDLAVSGDLADLFEAMRLDRVAERTAVTSWLWTLLSDPSALPAQGQAILIALCEAIAAGGEEPAAWLLATLVVPHEASGALLDALCLAYAKRGPQDRARMLRWIREWEPNAQLPFPDQPRAWTVALALVEAAEATPADRDGHRSARLFVEALPDTAPELRALLLERLGGLGDAKSIDSPLDVGEYETAVSVARRLRDEITLHRSYSDRWKNVHVRRLERTYQDEVLACLAEVEQARTLQDLRVIDAPEIREKTIRGELRAAAKGAGERGPTDLGERLQKLVKVLEAHCANLERVRALRRREISQPLGLGDLRPLLRARLSLLEPHQLHSAQVLLKGEHTNGGPTIEEAMRGVPAYWEPLGFGAAKYLTGVDSTRLTTVADRFAAARSILENTIVDPLDKSDAALCRAYFGARRAEQGAALGIPDTMLGTFIKELLTYHLEERRQEAAKLLQWGAELQTRAQVAGLTAPQLAEPLSALRAAQNDPGHFDPDHYARLLGQHESELLALVGEQRDSALRLAEELGQLPTTAPGVATCIEIGQDALRAAGYGVSLEAFRLAIEGARNPRDPAIEKRLARFLSQRKPAGTEVPCDVGHEDMEQADSAIARLASEVEHKRDTYFSVDDAQSALDALKQLHDRRPEVVEPHLADIRQKLENAPYLDEPIGFGERFTRACGLDGTPSGAPQIHSQSGYLQAAGEPFDLDKAAAILSAAAAGLKPTTPAYRATQAEWARVQALRVATGGSFEEARQLCEDLFFLMRRHAKTWADTSVPQPADEPLLAVQVLFAANLLARAFGAGRSEDPATWISEHTRVLRGNFPIDGIKRSLSANTTRESNLVRLIGVALALPPDDSELMMTETLERMSRWQEEPGWLGRALASQLRQDQDANARTKLAFLLTNYAARAPEWSLDVLGELASASRDDDDTVRQWQNLRRHLDSFARAKHTRQKQVLLSKVLELTLRVSSASGKTYLQCVDGIRRALLMLEPSTEPPVLKVSLEEELATVDGNSIEFAVALGNDGAEMIHDIHIVSASKSQVSLQAPEDTLRITENLYSQQSVVVRIPGVVSHADETGHVTLGLKITFRGSDDRIHEQLPSFNVRTRNKSDIPDLKREEMLKLFTESGVEVTREGTDFFGRERELEELRLRLLEKEPPEPNLLQGMRRIGKTSLARVFLEHAEQGGDHAAFIDFKYYSDKANDAVPPWRTFAFLASQVLRTNASDGPVAQRLGYSGINWSQQVFDDFEKSAAPAQLLADILVAVADNLPDGRIVIVLDELDYFVNHWLGSATTKQNVYDFFNVLRGLFAQQKGGLGRFRWLLLGSDRCRLMFDKYDHPLYGSIARMTISGVDKSECDQILLGPFARLLGKKIRITDTALEEVYALTRGVPFFVQIIGNRLCSVLLDAPTDIVSRWHIRQAVLRSLPRRATGEPPAPYDRLLEPLSDRTDQPILNYLLALIADRTTHEEPTVRLQDVLGFSEQLVGARLSRNEIMTLLQQLSTYEIIEINTDKEQLAYEIPFPLVRLLLQTKYDYQIAVVKEAVLRFLDIHAGS